MNAKEMKKENASMAKDFLPGLLGSFSKPAAENPTTTIMEAAFRHHGLHYRYINCEVGPENLQRAVEGAKAMGWRGFNCSIPNKVEIIKYLDQLGESARIIGAVNTVVIEKDDILRGENTDGKGFVKAILEVTPVRGKKLVVFGAGGASRAICVEMALAGASDIMVVNVHERGRDLVDLLNQKTHANASFVEWNHTFEIPSDTDIVINATSIGFYPNVDGRLNIDVETLLPHMVVADCIPNPANTHFVKDAKRRGCKHVLTGSNMLVNQAVIALKYWTGIDVDSEVMHQELNRIFNQE